MQSCLFALKSACFRAPKTNLLGRTRHYLGSADKKGTSLLWAFVKIVRFVWASLFAGTYNRSVLSFWHPNDTKNLVKYCISNKHFPTRLLLGWMGHSSEGALCSLRQCELKCRMQNTIQHCTHPSLAAAGDVTQTSQLPFRLAKNQLCV